MFKITYFYANYLHKSTTDVVDFVCPFRVRYAISNATNIFQFRSDRYEYSGFSHWLHRDVYVCVCESQPARNLHEPIIDEYDRETIEQTTVFIN